MKLKCVSEYGETCCKTKIIEFIKNHISRRHSRNSWQTQIAGKSYGQKLQETHTAKSEKLHMKL